MAGTIHLHAARPLLQSQALAGELIAPGAHPHAARKLESLEVRVDLDSPRPEIHPLLVTLGGGGLGAGSGGDEKNAERQRCW